MWRATGRELRVREALKMSEQIRRAIDKYFLKFGRDENG